MKKISLITSVAGACLGLLAVTAPTHARTWTGGYVTVTAGGNQAPGRGETLVFDANGDGTYGDTIATYNGSDAFAAGFCNGTANGPTVAQGCYEDDGRASLSARLGYDWQFGSFIVGVLADYNGVKVTDGVAGFATDPSLQPESYSLTRSLDGIVALRARVGYGYGDWMGYITGGAAQADIDRGFMTSNAFNSFSATNGDDKANGYQAGLGLEHTIDDHWSMGLEYLHTSLDDDGVTVHAGPGAGTFASNPFLIANPAGSDIRRSEDKIEIDSVMVTLSYRFGGM